MPISSVWWATANKDATFSAFFDLEKIQTICNSYGLEFQQRFSYRANGSVSLLGELKQNVVATTSWYDQRRNQKQSTERKTDTSKTLTESDKQAVNELNDRITELTATLRPIALELKAIRADILDLKSRRKRLPAGADRQQLYEELEDKKLKRNKLLDKDFILKNQRKVCKAMKYNRMYMKKPTASSAADSAELVQVPADAPSTARPGYEDDAKHIDISTLQDQAAKTAKKNCLQWNRLWCGDTVNNSEDIDWEDVAVATVPTGEICYRLTSEQISQMSLVRSTAIALKKRKKKYPEVMSSEKILSENAMSLALTAEEILNAHKVAQDHRECLRSFYYSRRSKKETLTRYFRMKAAYDRLSRDERKFVGGDVQVISIGNAGTGVGSRIGGHMRYGGKQIRARHRRYATVCMTDEYMTSQIFSTCFHPVVRAQKRVKVGDKWKTKTVSGSSICYNDDCPRYQWGCNTKNRDVEAAINIALAGVSRITTGITLTPFERSSRQ